MGVKPALHHMSVADSATRRCKTTCISLGT